MAVDFRDEIDLSSVRDGNAPASFAEATIAASESNKKARRNILR
jgi:hypothetical protein